jgi:hypothetical protein
MIEILGGFPDSVVAFSASGRVTRGDYEAVLVPRVEAALQHHDKIRCYYELGAGFTGFDPGAMWEDFKVGIGHLSRWERVAVVTDVDWIRHATNAFRFLMPAEMRVFPTAEAEAARGWIAA